LHSLVFDPIMVMVMTVFVRRSYFKKQRVLLRKRAAIERRQRQVELQRATDELDRREARLRAEGMWGDEDGDVETVVRSRAIL